MALPEAVQKQIDAVDKHFQQLPSGDAQVLDDAAVTPQPSAPIPDAEKTPVEPAPVPTAAPQGSDDWKHKYDVLKGKYDAEVPRLNAQVRDLGGKVTALETLIASMQSTPPAQPVAQSPQAAPTYLTQKDVDEYGSDFVDVVQRAALEKLAPYIAHIQQLEGRLAELQNVVPAVNDVAQQQQRTAEQLFFDRLSAAIPTWESDNQDQDFVDWLAPPDQFSGLTKLSLLQDARSRLDVDRVIAIFRAWHAAKPASVAAPVAVSAQAELESQVSPGRSRSAKTVEPEAIQWTRAKVAKFYDDVRKGAFVKRQSERDRLERDLFLAQREGRIAP